MPKLLFNPKSAAQIILLALVILALTAGPVLAAVSAPVFQRAWGGFGFDNGQFISPYAIKLAPDGYLYVADSGNDRIQVFDSSGQIASLGGIPAVFGMTELNAPHGVAVDASGNVYVADTFGNRVVKYNSSHAYVGTIGGSLSDPVQLKRPFDLAVDNTLGLLYVADTYNHRIVRLNLNLTVAGPAWGGPGYGSDSTHFNMPTGMAVDSAGNTYVADSSNHRIVVIAPNGTRSATWGGIAGSADGQFNQPRGVSISGDGFVYVADTGNGRIQKFASDGTFVTKWGTFGSAAAQFNNPYSLAAGSNDTVFVADTYNDRIQAFEKNIAPYGLALNPSAVNEDKPVGTDVGTLSAQDSNTGEPAALFSYSLVTISGSNCADNSLFTVANTTLRTNTVFDYETGSKTYHICLRVTDSGGLTNDSAQIVTINDVPEAPVVNDTAFNLKEWTNETNPATKSGTVVGLITATNTDSYSDPSKAALTFTVEPGPFAAAFKFTQDTITGNLAANLVVNDPTLLDYETAPNHDAVITIKVTNNTSGLSDTAVITVHLTNENDPPVITLTAPIQPQLETTADGQGGQNNQVIGNIVITDPDGQKVNAPTTNNSTFKLVANNTTVPPSYDIALNNPTAATFNYEVGSTHQISFNISAADTGAPTPNKSGTLTVKVDLLNIDEKPSFVAVTALSIPENSAVGTIIGTPVASDPEAKPITFTVSSTTFSIDSLGRLKVIDNTLLDYEALTTTGCANSKRCIMVDVTADDGTTGVVSGKVQVSVTDVNEAPVINLTPLYVPENTANTMVIGTVTATDPEGNAMTFTTTDPVVDPTNPFSITPTGVVSVRNTALLNHEIQATYNFPVTVTDKGSPVKSSSTTILVYIQDVNEQISIDPAKNIFTAIDESPNGTVIGSVNFTDPDENTIPAYYTFPDTKTGCLPADAYCDGFGIFDVNSSGEVYIKNNASLSYAAGQHTYHLNVNANDQGFNPATRPDAATDANSIKATNANGILSIQINPAILTNNLNLVVPEKTTGASAGFVTVRDDLKSADLVYSIVDSAPAGAFAINATTGQITVADGSLLDYETAVNHTVYVTVEADNTQGLLGKRTYAVRLTDINEPPVFADQSFSILEDAPAGMLVGTLKATDPDGNPVTFALVSSSPSAVFTVSASGQVKVADRSLLKYAVSPTFTLNVTASDSLAAPVPAVLTIQLTPQADLAITNVSVPTPVLTGASFNAAIEVTNLGAGDSGAYTIQTLLARGFILDSNLSTPGCTQQASGMVQCSSSGLAAHAKVTFDLVIQMQSSVTNGRQLDLLVVLATTGTDLITTNNTGQTSNPIVVKSKIEFLQDFEGAIEPGWSSNATADTTPVGGRRFLGQFSNDEVDYTLGLQYQSAEVEFDLYVIRSWDGSGDKGPDVFQFGINDDQLLSTTFSNWVTDANEKQSYPDPYVANTPGSNWGMTGSVEQMTLGYSFGSDTNPMDSVYHFQLKLDKPAAQLVLKFMASGLTGGLADESWGIDNLHITLKGTQMQQFYIPRVTR